MESFGPSFLVVFGIIQVLGEFCMTKNLIKSLLNEFSFF